METINDLRIIPSTSFMSDGSFRTQVAIFRNGEILNLRHGQWVNYSTNVSKIIYQSLPITIEFPESGRSKDFIAWELNFEPEGDSPLERYTIDPDRILVYNIQQDSQGHEVFSIAIMVDQDVKSGDWKNVLNDSSYRKRNLESNGSYYYPQLDVMGRDIDILPHKTILLHGVKINQESGFPELKFLTTTLSPEASQNKEHINLVEMRSPISEIITNKVFRQIHKYRVVDLNMYS